MMPRWLRLYLNASNQFRQRTLGLLNQQHRLKRKQVYQRQHLKLMVQLQLCMLELGCPRQSHLWMSLDR
jgi:hypothetical protein